MRSLCALLLACLGTALPAAARAEVALPPVLSKGMVLQRGETVPIWGTAAAGEKVMVEFRDKTAEAVADKDGKWRVSIPPGEPGGPFVMKVKGTNEIAIEDVLVGDVWVCSGQSNMVSGMNVKPPAGAEGKIRACGAVGKTQFHWGEPQNFSIIGWATGCAAYEQEKVPVGLIFAAIGGTGIAGWMAAPAPDPAKPGTAAKPGGLYANSLLRVQPYAIKGVVWWQGENDGNLFSGTRYEQQFKALIAGWRRDWGQGDFPFIFIQLQMQAEKEVGSGFQWVRESQRRALEMPKTGMVVTFDVTDGNLHPKKDEIARRVAPAVQAIGYGKDVEWSGPLFEKAELKGEELVLSFSHTGKGMAAKGGGKLEGFEIRAEWPEPRGSKGCDRFPGWALPEWAKDRGIGYVPVEARLSEDGKQVIVPIAGLKPPLRVRYAFAGMAKGNLYNDLGLPASPFVGPSMGEEQEK